MTGAGVHAEGRHLQPLLQELKAVGATRGQGYEVRPTLAGDTSSSQNSYVLQCCAMSWPSRHCCGTIQIIQHVEEDPVAMGGRSGPAIYFPSRQRHDVRMHLCCRPSKKGSYGNTVLGTETGGTACKVKTRKVVAADHLSSKQLARMSPDHILPKRGLSRLKEGKSSIAAGDHLRKMCDLHAVPKALSSVTSTTNNPLDRSHVRNFVKSLESLEDTIPRNRSENLHLSGTP